MVWSAFWGAFAGIMIGPVPLIAWFVVTEHRADIDAMDRAAERLAEQWKAGDARTPLGQWTLEDILRYDHRQIGEAATGGHMVDLGFMPPPGALRCGLHGDTCAPPVAEPLVS